MAWALKQAVSTGAAVYFEVSPSCEELEPSEEYYKQAGISYGALTTSAASIEDRFWPKQARIMTDRKHLPNLVNFCSFWGVSHAFMNYIEELEPDVHEFREVEILKRDGSNFSAQYFAINIMNTVKDAVVWEHTSARSKQYGNSRRLLPLRERDSGKIAIRASAVDRFHLWVSHDLISSQMTVSNELYSILKNKGLLAHIRPFEMVER